MAERSLGRSRRALPVIGLLDSWTAEAYGQFLAPLRGGLAEVGYIEGRDVLIEYRLLRADEVIE